MRKIVGTMLAAVLLLGALVVPASAEEPTLAELEAAVAAAQAAVDTIRGEIAALEEELAGAEEALRLATADVDAQQAIVDALAEDLAEAETALAAAEALLAELQAAYDACTTGQCRNAYAHPVHGGPLTDARADVLDKEAAVDDLQSDLDDAREELSRLAALETEAAGEVARIEAAITSKEAELETAEAALTAAQDALDGYVAPTGEEAAPRPGCQGVANAAAQVQGKGKASQQAKDSLVKVAAKLNCDAA